MLCSFDLTFHLNKAAPFGESSRCLVVSPKPTRSSLYIEFCPALHWRRIPSPFLLLNLIPLFCSQGSVYKFDNIHWQWLNGDEDKDRNIDSVNGEVGVDSTSGWDNRVIRDGPLAGLKVAEGTYQSSDTHIIHCSNICFQTQFIFLHHLSAYKYSNWMRAILTSRGFFHCLFLSLKVT